MPWRLRCPLSHLFISFISCACSVVPVLHQSLSQSFHTPFNSSSLCVFLHLLSPNSHLGYKSEHCASVIAGLRAAFEPMTCMDTNESQSACWIQPGDRLIPFPPFSIREKATPAVLHVPKHFSLKSAPTAKASALFLARVLLFTERVFWFSAFALRVCRGSGHCCCVLFKATHSRLKLLEGLLLVNGQSCNGCWQFNTVSAFRASQEAAHRVPVRLGTECG